MTPGAVGPGTAGRPVQDAAAAQTGPLAGRRFRANPRYELVLFDRLAPAERRALARLSEQAGFYGVLRPREPLAGAGLAVKAVDRETALLLLTLGEPGPLPAYLDEVLGTARARTVARLVADGALEVESDGSFVSGPAALGLLAGVSRGGKAPGGRLAELSLAALRWAALLPVDDPLLLAARLYAYNRRPLTPCWARSLPGEEAVRAYLGIAGRGEPVPGGTWYPVPARGSWLLWAARSAPPRPAPGPTFKLYVSPQPEALPAVFAEALAVLAGAGAQRLKVGSDAAGILRPDKLVAYFGELDRLAAAAEALSARLAGVPAQGVPFTAEIAGDGLLSWGAEPPRTRRLAGRRESWRLWLANRLACALVEARAEQRTAGSDRTMAAAGGSPEEQAAGAPASAEGPPEPWRFALERLRLEGVDTEIWAPGALFWTQG